MIGDHDTAQTGPPVIENAHDVAIAQATGRRILRVDLDRFMPVDFYRTAVGPIVHLRMQLSAGLVRQHMQRIAFFRGPHPFDWLHPCRMSRAVIITEIRYALGEQLDPATRRGKRRSHRIGKKFRQKNPVLIQRRRFIVASPAEILIVRHVDIDLGRRSA